MDSTRMHDHFLFKWLGIAAGAVTLAIAIGAIAWFLLDQRQREEAWYQDDLRWNAAILDSLDDLQDTQSKILNQLVKHELQLLELESEHRDIAKSAYQIGFNIAATIGRHEGHHDTEQSNQN